MRRTVASSGPKAPSAPLTFAQPWNASSRCARTSRPTRRSGPSAPGSVGPTPSAQCNPARHPGESAQTVHPAWQAQTLAAGRTHVDEEPPAAQPERVPGEQHAAALDAVLGEMEALAEERGGRADQRACDQEQERIAG